MGDLAQQVVKLVPVVEFSSNVFLFISAQTIILAHQMTTKEVRQLSEFRGFQ
jgi:hypothetical protein